MNSQKKSKLWLLALVPVPMLGLLVRVGEARIAPREHPRAPAPVVDLSRYSDTPPPEALRVLFIHHSVGGQLMAQQGPDDGGNSIHATYPNGGGARMALEQAGYEVHEASYGSVIGDRTDLPDWLPTFRDHMDRVLHTSHQDELYDGDQRNQVVMFKSCYPANDFVGRGEEPGDAESRELTVSNAKAALTALLPHFAENRDTLFVYFTAPPLAPRVPGLRLWRSLLYRSRGTLWTEARVRRGMALARDFNDWVVSPDGWLSDYPHHNAIAFDYYDILTGHGLSDLTVYPTDDGHDPHPSSDGQARAAEELVPFLNRAVRRAGIAPRAHAASAD